MSSTKITIFVTRALGRSQVLHKNVDQTETMSMTNKHTKCSYDGIFYDCLAKAFKSIQ